MPHKSAHSVSVTLDRLTDFLTDKGIAVIARVNHAAAAAKVDMDLRPTELLLFGNPMLGTPLMQSNQQAGFDLPMKALAWQDAEGDVWLRLSDPQDLVEKHGLLGVDPVIQKMTAALGAMATAATG